VVSAIQARPIPLECSPPAALLLHPHTRRPWALLIFGVRGAPPQTIEIAAWQAYYDAAPLFPHLPDVRGAIDAARVWIEKQVTAPAKGASGEVK
jgi:hypothetical protein